MLLVLMLLVFLVSMLWSRWYRRDLYNLAKQLKSSYRSLPFIGHSYLFIGGEEHRMKSIQLFGMETIRMGGTAAFWHAFDLYIFVADPVVAETVLKHCLQKPDVMKVTHELLGNGSIFAPVEIWRPRRKILAPTFSPKNLTMFMDIFVRQSSVMVDNMSQAVNKGTFSVWNILSTYTMDSVFETTLGIKLGTQKNCDHPFLKAIDILTNIAATRICRPWLHSNFIFKKSSHWKTVVKERGVAFDLINKVITEKRKAVNKNSGIVNDNSDKTEGGLKTFLELLMQLSSGSGGYTDVELREETLVIVIAGTDTSAVGIAFTMMMLYRHPDIQEKVYQELKEVFGDSDRDVESQDLQKLVYLDAVIKETLRLYPPVPVIMRKVEKDIELPTGVTLVKGCSVLIHLWAIHRNPQYWGDDADDYRPERFFDTPLKHPVAFVPFSQGPRSCLGSQYAMMSMKVALGSLLRRYRVLPPAKNQISNKLRVKFDVMMRDVDGYLVELEQRT